MTTEDVSARFVDLDGWPTRDAVEAMYEGQLAAVAAVRPGARRHRRAPPTRPPTRCRRGGRLVYAGRRHVRPRRRCRTAPSCRRPSTGRSTSSSSPWRAARARSIRAPRARRTTRRPPSRTMDEAGVGPDDVVIGIAASGTTPYTVARRPRGRRSAGAVTIGIANNPDAPLLGVARHPC